MYYFVLYKWKRKGISNWIPCNTVICTHPITWLIETTTEHNSEEYVIEFYKEISELEYYSAIEAGF